MAYSEDEAWAETWRETVANPHDLGREGRRAVGANWQALVVAKLATKWYTREDSQDNTKHLHLVQDCCIFCDSSYLGGRRGACVSLLRCGLGLRYAEAWVVVVISYTVMLLH
jgi:hypothetical protein